MQFTSVVFLGIGGAAGAIARYLVSKWVTSALVSSVGAWPMGTLFVNVVGSFLLALFSIWIVNRAAFSEEMRLLIATGFFGAFTTFSTFANESVSLLRMGEITTGIAYIALTNFLCLLAVMLALWLANRSII
jgi:CrcB protein